jgi:radical SAM superfamily enzyme YgiQ (UPF0313 family)
MLGRTKLLRLAQVGIQSGSERLSRDIFRRNTPKSTVIRAAGLFHRHKIKANYHLIFDNPFAQQEDNRETLELILAFPRPFTLSLYSLTYFPKTELTNRALERGFIDSSQIEGSSDKSLSQIYISPEYKRDPLERFYINLIYLAQVPFIPRAVVRLLLKAKPLKRYPYCLEQANRLIDSCNRFFYGVIPLASRGIRHLLRGRLNFARLNSGLRSFKVIVTDKRNF